MNANTSRLLFSLLALLWHSINISLADLNETSFNYFKFKNDHVIFKNGNAYKFLINKRQVDYSNQNNYKRLHLIKEVDQSEQKAFETFMKDGSSSSSSSSLLRVNNLKEYEQQNEHCFYSSIKLKLNECFQNSSDCKSILNCIASLNLVEVCHHYDMNTPAIWIINVFEILNNKGFCNLPVECDSPDNEYLRKLDEIMKSFHEYGQAYLDQPKVDNKVYCSKSHHLVLNVRDLFDALDQCFNITIVESIMNSIEDSADSILDRNCLYCISTNSIFDDCEMDNYGNDLNCNGSLKCIYDKIDQYKCNKDKDVTPLTLISSFMKNISNLCELDNKPYVSPLAVDIISTPPQSIAVEWFKSLNYCIKDRRFLGLTIIESPPNVDLCHEMDETFKCIHNTVHSIDQIKSKITKQFALFANQYTRLQRTCDAYSLTSKIVFNNQLSVTTRHPFQNNSEQTVIENDKNYYHQTVIRAEIDQSINWINLDSSQFIQHQVKKDDDLSKNYLKATIVKLKFKFPYYGHLLEQIVVATGGFLYVGSLMNPLITKAQYIAPLMANFDPTLSNRTIIKYVDNGTHFVVTWENLILQDQAENGEYSFQVILNRDGGIIFNYKKIPSVNISTINHTVKIGLSDAYVYYKILSTSKIEYTIVQYHVVNVPIENIKTGNSIMFFMLKNCLQLKTCETCLKGTGNFKCLWCPTLQRCSDTMDRYRQEWIESACPIDLHTVSNQTCLISVPAGSNKIREFDTNFYTSDTTTKDTDYFKSVFVGIFVTILVSMLLTTASWIVYAYKNPTSPSGIWLIEHRPEVLFRMLSSRLYKNSPQSSRFENPVA